MGHFTSYDGTELGYRVAGAGPPLVCLPGGPGRAADYLGDLGGLDRTRRLIQLDPRGVGRSPAPADPATFRVDRLVDDVEALRVHLGVDRMDLLAHSAGAILATLYAAAHPGHVARLALVTPSLAALGIASTEAQFDATARRRATEAWYPAARAALERIFAGDLSMAAFQESRPLCYGRWTDDAAAHSGIGMSAAHQAARRGYFAGVELDPRATTAALTTLTAPVLLYAGTADPMVAPGMIEAAAPLFPDATVVIEPGAGHFPWIDDPAAFAATVDTFLR